MNNQEIIKNLKNMKLISFKGKYNSFKLYKKGDCFEYNNQLWVVCKKFHWLTKPVYKFKTFEKLPYEKVVI